MATPPRVHRAELAAALARISARRVKVDDPDREQLPDSPEADPREVLDYLQKHSGPHIPRWVLQAEVLDALTLLNWLWWQDQAREHYWLQAGRERGLFLAQLGAQRGIGKQGIRDRIDRGEALLLFHRPDEQLTREARRNATAARGRRGAELAWIAEHRVELHELISGLLAQADQHQLHDTQREWLDELAADARADDLTPATMVVLGLACAELRNAPGVLTLDSARQQTVHTLLAHADRLRSRFADCSR
ncbi:hypothetical protein [Saccharopolyspora griseoalba]|uniref:Uncharacterized protein n=1 Tax=Saccharopolyspora griseoalba TaxID=1431848 RepID=A0ABW2LWE4_9PSEU